MIENKLHGPSHYSSLEDLLMQVILQGNEQVKVDVDIVIQIVYDIFFSSGYFQYGYWQHAAFILTHSSIFFPYEPDPSSFNPRFALSKV